MHPDPLPDPSSLSPAESLFAQHLAHADAGEPSDFEALCRAHPQAATELRQLKAEWNRHESIARRAGLGQKAHLPLAYKLRSRFGSYIDRVCR